jgi:hypothetical protein
VFDEPQSQNPFASPLVADGANDSRRLDFDAPTLPKVMAILDIVFCAVRVLMVYSAVTAVSGEFTKDLEIVAKTGWYEIAAGSGIALFGVVAAIGILMKASWAAPIGWMAIAFTVLSVAVGVWQIAIMWAEIPPGSPDQGMFLMSTAIAAMIRVALLWIYAVALLNYAAWVRRRADEAPQWPM